jgi:hypothetical protein
MAIDTKTQQEYEAMVKRAKGNNSHPAIKYGLPLMTVAGIIIALVLIKHPEYRGPAQREEKPSVNAQIDGRDYHCTPIGEDDYRCSPSSR